MRRSRSQPLVNAAEVVPSRAMLAAIDLLRDARDAAAQTKYDKWQFAVSINTMTQQHVGETDLRRLIAFGFAEHRHEVLKLRSGRRMFAASANLALTAQSCFVLGPAAHRFVAPVGARPRWDRERRQLWYGHLLVKQYFRRAECQEIILSTFEDDGWLPRIDDPLPRVPELDPKTRLHDAVQALNRRQLNRLLTFHRDGTGEGVIWRGR